MTVQTITTPGGERLVILAEADYRKLTAAAENAADIAAYDRVMARIERGEEELIPSEILNRLLEGQESRLRVWREYRGLPASALAEKIGISGAYLSEIETGKKSGSIPVMKKIAAALRVDLDDIA